MSSRLQQIAGGRRRVREQLKKRDCFGYYQTSFSDLVSETGDERFVRVAEQGRSVWRGEGQHLSYRLCQAILKVLAGTDEPPHWSQRARTAFAEVRADFP